ncbi:MAG: arginine--tRNA ligase [Anaerolineaceae bacterium]|nr:arginine--tRNA ligase [Anaerolineaceae bacterium]
MFETEQINIALEIQQYCGDQGLPPPIIQWNWIPFSGHWGISTPFFQTAAQEAKAGKKINISQRAQEIAQSVASHFQNRPEFERVEAVNGYLNLYYSTNEFARRVVDEVLSNGVRFGRGEARGKRVMVEFSQPNTHKAFHVGHLRNVILGDAVSSILEFAGFDVVRANYYGDIGLHVIKWLWNYLKFHEGEEPSGDMVQWLGKIYAEADQRYEEDPAVQEEVRALFGRWDRGDPEIVALWEKTRTWSLEAFDRLYQMLGVRFDHVYFESEVEESGKQLVAGLIKQGIARDERPEGAVIVPLDDLAGTKDKFRVLVALRSDGTSLYATKDLSLAIKKFEEFNLDTSIYVIDVRQSLYMQQIFKTLELMGYDWARNCYHLAYEIVNLPGNVTMSSRDGTIVLLEDLLREATSRALEIVQQKNPELPQGVKEDIAKTVAFGAIKYSMLSRDNTKIVTFDWNSALDFNGQAAPYIQYAYVRANSILKKTEKKLSDNLAVSYPLNQAEIELIELISRFPGEVQRAAKEYRPLYLSTLAFELARSFNDFYNQCPVLQAEEPIRSFRIRLTTAAKQTIHNCLEVLGIRAPEIM